MGPEFEASQLFLFWIIILFDRNWDNLKEDVIILVLFCGNGLVRLQRSRLVSSECPYPPLWGSSENGKDFRAQHISICISYCQTEDVRASEFLLQLLTPFGVVPKSTRFSRYGIGNNSLAQVLWRWGEAGSSFAQQSTSWAGEGGGVIFVSTPPTPTPPHRQKTVGRARYGAENQALLTQAEQTEPYMGLSWVCGTDPANSQNHLSKQGRILGASSSSLSQGEKRSIS